MYNINYIEYYRIIRCNRTAGGAEEPEHVLVRPVGELLDAAGGGGAEHRHPGQQGDRAGALQGPSAVKNGARGARRGGATSPAGHRFGEQQEVRRRGQVVL